MGTLTLHTMHARVSRRVAPSAWPPVREGTGGGRDAVGKSGARRGPRVLGEAFCTCYSRAMCDGPAPGVVVDASWSRSSIVAAAARKLDGTVAAAALLAFSSIFPAPRSSLAEREFRRSSGSLIGFSPIDLRWKCSGERANTSIHACARARARPMNSTWCSGATWKRLLVGHCWSAIERRTWGRPYPSGCCWSRCSWWRRTPLRGRRTPSARRDACASRCMCDACFKSWARCRGCLPTPPSCELFSLSFSSRIDKRLLIVATRGFFSSLSDTLRNRDVSVTPVTVATIFFSCETKIGNCSVYLTSSFYPMILVLVTNEAFHLIIRYNHNIL